jgi:hypothetical protein
MHEALASRLSRAIVERNMATLGVARKAERLT